MSLIIRPIEAKSDVVKFVKCQWDFYKDDPNWVPPMKMDRMNLLNTKTNPFYQHSLMQLFLAEDNGEIVGRIAAIINDNHNKTHNDKVGFFGFFECVNDQNVADLLFNTANDWLKSRGMDTSRGPVNPSLNDETGLLIEGYNMPAVTLMTYNPEYYAELIENAGFAKAKDLYAYLLEMHSFLTDKMRRMQSIIRKRYQIKIRKMNFKNKAKFKEDVKIMKELYNKAWEDNWGFVKMTDAEFEHLAKDMKMVADPNFTLIVEIKGKPAGFVLGLPDINQCFIKNRSGSTLGGIWHLMTKKKKIDTLRIIVLGVLPEYRSTGADAALYYEFFERGSKRGIKFGEASWILEDNLMMNRALTVTMNGKKYKTYRLYDKAI